MTVRGALREARCALELAAAETPMLDSSLLLAHVLGITREKLYMDLALPLPKTRREEFQAALRRRASGEPVAWILGAKEFWGLPLAVGPGALCPRPDSETLVEAALNLMGEIESAGGGARLHDLCSGPGTLAVALAAEKPGWTVSASDLSTDTPAFFRENNRNFAGGRIEYHHSDLLESVPGPFEIIVANPPYLTSAELSERRSARWREPAMALDGGEDGLDLIRRLIPQAAGRLAAGGFLLLEAAPAQMPRIAELLRAAGFEGIEVTADLAGRNRVICGRVTESS